MILATITQSGTVTDRNKKVTYEFIAIILTARVIHFNYAFKCYDSLWIDRSNYISCEHSYLFEILAKQYSTEMCVYLLIINNNNPHAVRHTTF